MWACVCVWGGGQQEGQHQDGSTRSCQPTAGECTAYSMTASATTHMTCGAICWWRCCEMRKGGSEPAHPFRPCCCLSSTPSLQPPCPHSPSLPCPPPLPPPSLLPLPPPFLPRSFVPPASPPPHSSLPTPSLPPSLPPPSLPPSPLPHPCLSLLVPPSLPLPPLPPNLTCNVCQLQHTLCFAAVHTLGAQVNQHNVVVSAA